MREDIERVFKALVNQPASLGKGGLSVHFLSSRLDIAPQRLLKIAHMLERAGYVRVRQASRVTLVSLTRSGYQRALPLREPPRQRPAPRQTHRLITLSGAGLMVVLVSFLWWWFDLFPPPSQLEAARLATVVSPTPQPVDPPMDTPSATPTATVTPSATTTPTSTPSPTPETTPNGPGLLPTAIPVDVQDAYLPTPVPLVEQSQDSINILLMGTDTSTGNWRTDTLIVVSVHPDRPSVSILSIPRDLYVYIPGWRMGRINTADYHGEQVGYPGGGPGLVKATIEYNLGIRVHYYARADFQGFVDILDTIGGVDVIVDCELHDTFPDPDAAAGQTDIDLLPGVHHLDAKQALWYARSRWNTNDFDRGRRQQRVLRGAFRQVKQLGLLTKTPELWDDLTQTVETDLPLDTALWLASVATRLNSDIAIKSRFIDFTVVREWLTPQGAAVLMPVYEKIQPLVAEALAPTDTARARQGQVRVEVLNGTTWSAWGTLAADRLLWEGFEVVRIGQADRDDYGQTLIVDLTETEKGSPVSYLASVMRVDESNVLRSDALADSQLAPALFENAEGVDFRVVVGHDYMPCYTTYWRAVHRTP